MILAENDELTQTLDQQKDWLQIAKEKIEILQNDLSDASSTYRNQEMELSQCREELKKATEMLHDTKEEYVCLQFEKEEADAKLEKYSKGLKEHQSVLADNENLIEQLNSQVAALKSALVGQEQTTVKEEFAKVDKKEEIQLHTELEAAEMKLKEYSQKISCLENRMKASEGLATKDVPPESPVIRNKRGIVTASPGVTGCLTPDKSILGMKQTASAKKQYDSPYSPSAKSNQQQTIRNLQRLLDDTTKTLEKKNAMVVSKTNHIQNLESQIKTLESKTLVNELKRSNTDLSNQLVKLNNEIDRLKFDLDNQEENIGSLQEQIEQKSDELKNSQTRLDITLQELKSKEDGLGIVSKSKESEIAALRESHQNEVSQLAEMVASLKEQHRCELLKVQTTYHSEINEVEGKYFDLQQTCDKLKIDIIDLEQCSNESKAQVEALRNDLEKKENDAVDCANAINDLEASKKKFQSDLVELQVS